MPRRKWIDKKSASHFTLVHRPQNDPLIHDESAPSMVLNPTQQPKESKAKQLDDLASELGSDAQSVRENEGEAANYGIYYDDSEYDYMQHLRDMGQGGGEAVFVEAAPVLNKGKGKQKEALQDALRRLDLEGGGDRPDSLLDEQILPAKNLPQPSYESQQDVPDAIAGLQPDMDPRLREVLEALDDEAYMDDGDDDIFQELAKNPVEMDEYDFDETYDEDDGWESDDTAKPTREFRDADGDETHEAAVEPSSQPEVGPSQDWMQDFEKFKRDQKSSKATGGPKAGGGPAGASELQSSMWTTTTSGGRRKKRKGALTNASGYSMTSSSLVRTEQMSILDSRFDKIDEEYGADADDGASVSVMSTASSVQGPTRSDFDGLLDEFLGGYSMQGKKVQKGKWNSGTEQLDQIRRDLGPARVRPKYR